MKNEIIDLKVYTFAHPVGPIVAIWDFTCGAASARLVLFLIKSFVKEDHPTIIIEFITENLLFCIL